MLPQSILGVLRYLNQPASPLLPGETLVLLNLMAKLRPDYNV